MRASRAWTAGCVLGLAAVFLTSLAAWLFPLGFLVAIAVGFVGVRRMGVSGYLTGFGLVWLALLGFQFASGGHLDNWQFWLMVGVLPVMGGIALGVWASES